MTAFVFLSICCQSAGAQSPISNEEAILALIGESSGECFLGKVAVAETIRRRGSLKGVYGLKAPRVKAKRYSKATYNECARAWEASKSTNYSLGAVGWGNLADLKVFRRQRWFKKCFIVVQIGNHYFWNK